MIPLLFVLLTIDTSHRAQSFAVCDLESKQMILSKLYPDSNHVNLISRIIDEFKAAGLSVQALTMLAVTSGPGSFTGIRTGLTVIKTLAAELQLPVHLCSNFELLRWHLDRKANESLVLPAGKLDYFVSKDTNYDNLETNFYSTDDYSAEVFGYTDLNLAELLAKYTLEQNEEEKLEFTTAVEPYYLREPSIGVKS